MAGVLYLVGTPIGNLGDLSPRAAEILGAVDFIAAEDTRVTLKLLNHFGIKKPLLSYYEHNKVESAAVILPRLLAGESCALVSDAGMPAISDPGEALVRLCAEQGVEVRSVPGPSAVVTALALSGLPTQRFAFEGFLSTANKSRREHLESLREEHRTLVIYEAPHKLTETLSDLLEVLGDRDVALCRELTKLHEEVVRTTLSQALERYRAERPRGEFVLVIRGAPEEKGPRLSLEAALDLVERFRAEGRSLKEAARLAAAESGQSRNDLYHAALVRDREKETLSPGKNL
ncbi:MAG: 16S rRNA (cytidine(1402)-2'-O)-methyltransferase [Oscillospiraceae bacterium]|nr:16S rRNA (cytidine(1402)-2'-O)-methyltransferase [Oscillospiraceae bacterium]